MNNAKNSATTAISASSGSWKPVEEKPRLQPTDTRGMLNRGAVVVQGRYVDGGTRLVVTMDPAVVERKLAIREINDKLEGRAPRIVTFTQARVKR